MFKLLKEARNSFDELIDWLYIHPVLDKLCLYDFLKHWNSPDRWINFEMKSKVEFSSPLYYFNGTVTNFRGEKL